MGTGRYMLGGAGTQTAALGFGGYKVPATISAATEEYDGTSWTTGGSLITARYGLAGAGTQTAGLAFGGTTGYPTSSDLTEQYDGSSWTATGTMITGRRYLGGCGTQTSALAFGGVPTNTTTRVTNTEEFSGPGSPVTQTITTS
jgi:hypothetical protein